MSLKHLVLLSLMSCLIGLTSCISDANSSEVAGSSNLALGDHWLFCYLSGRGEWISYAVSEDGEHFQELLQGDSIFSPCEHARIEKGTRDAYVCRRQDNAGFLMVTTDMNVTQSRVWNNFGIDLLKSDNLTEWSSVSLDFRQGPQIFSNPEDDSVYINWSSICRVWAPQIIWDADVKQYMVYFSMLNLPEEPYDRVYYCYADSAFERLSQPKLLFDWGYSTIDADIQFVPTDGLYHMVVKREGINPGLVVSTSPSLTGPWKEPAEEDVLTHDGELHTEGASVFQLPNAPNWRMGFVERGTENVYRIGELDDDMRHLNNVKTIQGVTKTMHGSFMRITAEEYSRLLAWSNQHERNAEN